MTFLLCFNGTVVPPACSIQMRRKNQLGKILLEIGTRPSGQSLEFLIPLAPIDTADLVDFLPRFERDSQGTSRGRGCTHGAFHQAGVDMCQSITEAVLNIPCFWVSNRLCLLQKICHILCLLESKLG